MRSSTSSGSPSIEISTTTSKEMNIDAILLASLPPYQFLRMENDKTPASIFALAGLSGWSFTVSSAAEILPEY